MLFPLEDKTTINSEELIVQIIEDEAFSDVVGKMYIILRELNKLRNESNLSILTAARTTATYFLNFMYTLFC